MNTNKYYEEPIRLKCNGSQSCSALVEYPKLGLCRYCYDIYGIGDTYGKKKQKEK